METFGPQSVLAFEALGFQAIGTSSAAIAHPLGYQDGEQIPLSDLLCMVEKIKARIQVPLSVDMELGHGKTAEQVVDNIEKLYNFGVSGIHIEDPFIDNEKRVLQAEKEFSAFIDQIVKRLARKSLRMFITIRCDAFLLQLPDALNEAIQRVRSYPKLGIDGIFLPGITAVDDIKQIPAEMPIHVSACLPYRILTRWLPSGSSG